MGAAMLFLISLCGYPTDGLTESTVQGAQEVLKANKHVLIACCCVGLVVCLLVWMCGALGHASALNRLDHDRFTAAISHTLREGLMSYQIASVNSGGR